MSERHSHAKRLSQTTWHKKTAHYDKQLDLKAISLIFFVKAIDDESRKKYEVDFDDEETGVKVEVIFVEIGN